MVTYKGRICSMALVIFLLIALTIFFLTSFFSEKAAEEEIQKLRLELTGLKLDNSILEEELKDLAKSKNKITLQAIVTSYAPYDNKSGICNDGNPDSTSIGKKPGKSYAAADPARLPYGTRLFIPGYGIVEIADTGGALIADKENIRIDVFQETHKEAIDWGKQKLEVIILN